MTDELTAALQTNYSEIGSGLIEELYSQDDYLSLSGVEGSDRLASASGVKPGARVLDIGCGLGGPAMRFAAKHNLNVVGVDLVETNVAAARARVREAGLDAQVEIRQGDAADLDLPTDAFDAVFSQDAICHAPDKAAVFAEAARVAKPGATIGLCDWVETAAMSDAESARVLDALSAPNLETREGYSALLQRHGFETETSEDLSARFAARYEAVMKRLMAKRAEIVERFSPRVYDIMVEKNGALADAFAAGTLGGCLLIARRG